LGHYNAEKWKLSTEFLRSIRGIEADTGGADLSGFEKEAIIMGYLEYEYETHLPTLQNPPRPHPWFLGSHEDPRWSRRDQRPSRQGPQTLGSLSLAAYPI
jgi:hypothetical protein